MKGLIFIPDITGFTEFVKTIDTDLGALVTRELLNEIIDHNTLDVELSEVEGDALLFYKLGNPVALDDVFNAFTSIHDAFEKKFAELKEKYNLKSDLSLKIIVHYGEMSLYHIAGFKKLYGRAIIESHRLLKNGYHSSSYILITNDYMKALQSTNISSNIRSFKFSSNASQLFSDLREISYYFFNYVSEGCPELKVGQHNLSA